MAIPVVQLWRAGETKHLVQWTVRGIIPEGVRTSRHIGSIQSLRTLGLNRERPLIEGILKEPLFADLRYVETDRPRDAYHLYCQGGGEASIHSICDPPGDLA